MRSEHGRAYVDAKHRLRAWAQRQASLDFGPPSGWTPAQRELSAHMRKRESRKARMLARLQQGEATTWELMQLGGSGWRSRLHELKLDGYQYSCENRLDYAVYRLERS